MTQQKIEFITRLTREDVAGIVEALIEGLKEGHLKVHKSGDTLEMPVPRVIDLEVEAKLSPEKAKFSIEVSWRTNRAENPDLPDEERDDYDALDLAANQSACAPFVQDEKERAASKKKRLSDESGEKEKKAKKSKESAAKSSATKKTATVAKKSGKRAAD